MVRRYRFSLNLRLWLVIAIACLPVLFIAFSDFRERRQEAVDSLTNEIERMLVAARMAANYSRQSLEQTFQIMARADNLQSLDPQDCSHLSQRLLKSLQNFEDLGAVLPDGRLFCSASNFAGTQPTNVASTRWFQDALQAPGMTAAALNTAPGTDQPSIVFGYPVHTDAGQLLAVLFASLPMHRFDQLMVELQLPLGWNAFLLSPQGKLLSYYPTEELPTTINPQATQAFEHARAQGQRIVQLPGLDGQWRLYGVGASDLTRETMLMAIGAPLGRNIERIQNGFWLRLALLAATALVSVLLARFYVYKLIEAWTQRSTAALQRIAQGDWSTPIARLSPVREFSAMEQGINHMAQELQHREAALRRLSVAVEQSPVGIIITDPEGRIEYLNPAFERMTGFTSADALGQRPDFLNRGAAPTEATQTMLAQLQAGQVWQGEFTNTRQDGSTYTGHTTISPLFGPQGQIEHFVAVQDDITERKETEALIYHLAYYDPLTGLPNRALMHERMAQAIVSQAHAKGCALVLLDIDRFKQINDTWGHAAGDALLCQMAERIQRSMPPSAAFVARLGSNTFGALVQGLGSGEAQSGTAALHLATQVHATLVEPYALDNGQRLYAATSVGVALLGATVQSPDQLLKQAEVALYRAESSSSNAPLLFDTAMQAAVDARATLEMGLRKALEAGGFALHYQVQVDTQGTPLGAEALIRWRDASGTPISPAVFIPLAEETGLIVPIGRWVLDTACQQLARWQAQPATRHLTLSVNVSARQFHQAEFADHVRSAIASSGIRPTGLVLELTESAILGGIETTIARMQELRLLGLRFALDDFGTGYSSLSYLQRLPFDELKIDQSFVRMMLADPASSAIVRAMLAMSDALGLKVVAEGVETAEHHDFLHRHHCQSYQGYWFGRPMPIADWEATHLGQTLDSGT